MYGRRFIEQFPIFLLCIPLTFVLNAANHYYGLLTWQPLLPPLLLYLVAGIVLYWLFRWIFRSPARATIFTSFLLTIFYFFSALHQWLGGTVHVLAKYSVLLPIVALATTGLFVWLKISRRSFQRPAYGVNLVFLLLTISGVVLLTHKYFTHAEKWNDQAGVHHALSNAYQPCDTCQKPDIYYLLLDGYTNSKTLENEFAYSNRAIENFLKEKGFHIIADSRSNYNFTHMSMASIFNLDYLAGLDVQREFHTREFLQSYYTIHRSEWGSLLEKEGYQVRNYSIFDLKQDASRVAPFLTELNFRSVPGQTFFHKLNRDIGWKIRQFFDPEKVSDRERVYHATNLERISQTIESVKAETIKRDTTPKFVYAHLILPHETFYFDSTGKRLPLTYTIHTPLNKKDYLQQLVYTNRFVIEPLVTQILQNNLRPAIIIVQGDHGYRNYPPEKIDLEFENFNAVYFPGGDYSSFRQTHSSVNSFRIVANQFFHQQLPLLTDSTINLMKVRTQ